MSEFVKVILQKTSVFGYTINNIHPHAKIFLKYAYGYAFCITICISH